MQLPTILHPILVYRPFSNHNGSQWLKVGERSLGDFLLLLSMPNDIKIGLSDYVNKIVDGAVTFGLIAIDFKRRFERKYTH